MKADGKIDDTLGGNGGTQRNDKYLAISFRVFSALLAAGLLPAAQCRRVANPARAMLGNLRSSTTYKEY